MGIGRNPPSRGRSQHTPQPLVCASPLGKRERGLPVETTPTFCAVIWLTYDPLPPFLSLSLQNHLPPPPSLSAPKGKNLPTLPRVSLQHSLRSSPPLVISLLTWSFVSFIYIPLSKRDFAVIFQDDLFSELFFLADVRWVLQVIFDKCSSVGASHFDCYMPLLPTNIHDINMQQPIDRKVDFTANMGLPLHAHARGWMPAAMVDQSS